MKRGLRVAVAIEPGEFTQSCVTFFIGTRKLGGPPNRGASSPQDSCSPPPPPPSLPTYGSPLADCVAERENIPDRVGWSGSFTPWMHLHANNSVNI